MAFYKPPNLPMHENGAYRKNTFEHILRENFGKEWAFVHRLDKETSGIVLCGNQAEARRRISISWQNGEVAKEYVAIARGTPSELTWINNMAIGDLEESRIRIKKWVREGGLPSETHFVMMEQKSDHFMVKALPKTGRTNQIRIHLASHGFPIVGDKLYHNDEEVFLEYWEKGATTNVIERVGHSRLCLHASKLSFIHPETGGHCTISCDLPQDMLDLWRSL
jgi:23S rRNA pseudouridine1911/1915/1917 synthase